MTDAELSISDATLIARLREIQGQAGLFASAAASRIEALTKERDEADDLAKAAFADGASNNIRLAETSYRVKWLEAKLATCEKYRDAYAECDRIGTQAVRDLEAKLATAVGALEFLEIAATGAGVPHPKERELLQNCIRKARATIAEIKKENGK